MKPFLLSLLCLCCLTGFVYNVGCKPDEVSGYSESNTQKRYLIYYGLSQTRIEVDDVEFATGHSAIIFDTPDGKVTTTEFTIYDRSSLKR